MRPLAGIVAALLLATACRGADPPPDGDRPLATPTVSTPGPPETVERETEPPEPSPAERDTSTTVWVAVEDDRRVVEVDLDARRVLREVPVPGHPHNLTVGGGTVAVTLQGAGIVVMIRGRRVLRVALGGSPHDVKAAGERVVVANEGAARLDVIGPGGDALSAIPLRANPHDLALAPDGITAWVTLDGSDQLAVVDVAASSVERYVPTGKRPHDILFAPDGRLWVTDWAGAVHVLSPRGRLLRSIALGTEAHHLAFTPDGREAWITDHADRKVFVVSARTLRVLAALPIPGAPHHVAITPDGRLAAVADHDRGSLLVFDVGARRRVAEIPVGHGPHGVWAA